MSDPINNPSLKAAIGAMRENERLRASIRDLEDGVQQDGELIDALIASNQRLRAFIQQIADGEISPGRARIPAQELLAANKHPVVEEKAKTANNCTEESVAKEDAK